MPSIKFFALISLLFSVTVSAQEYRYVDVQGGHFGYQYYLTRQGVPRVLLRKDCFKNTCWKKIVNQSGKELKIYSEDDSVQIVAEGRFNHRAYSLVSRSYQCSDGKCQQRYLISNQGEEIEFSNLPWKNKPLATRIGKDKTLYALSKSAFTIQRLGQSAYSLASPEAIISGQIGFNRNGLISVIAVALSGRIYWSDGQQWKRLNVKLTAHGDRFGVASIYPENKNQQYIALYRYVNEYNKGLYSLRYDPLSGKEEGGWLFNSEDRNIGFDPDIYSKSNGTIIIAATNASDKNDVHFSLTNADYSKLDVKFPAYITKNGFEEEKFASFMLGVGFSQLNWFATSRVESDGNTLLDVDYKISSSLYRSINFEGRVGNTNLTIQYLKNKAEDLAADEIVGTTNSNQQELADSVSRYLFSTIDFQGLVSPSAALRIQAEFGSIKGIAIIDKQSEALTEQKFSTEFKRIAVLAMQERGFYYGGDFISYTMPSAIGFSDSSKSVVYTNVDSAFGFQALRFVMGYDALAYSKRYETDYSRFYWSGSGNLGLGQADISVEIEKDALASTSASKINSLPSYFTLGLDLEWGYFWQQRFRRISGLGYSIALGYRASFSMLGAGQSKDSNPEDGVLYLEFNREDLLHGAFLKASIIF